MRFLHTADWQLGMTRHFLDADAQARYSAARLDAIRSIGRVVAEQQCEFVLVCGDVFESNHLDRRLLARAFEAMAEIPAPVYLLPGNHDPLDAASIYTAPEFTARCPANVHVLAEPGPHEPRDGVEIVAAPWTSKHPLGDPVVPFCADLGPPDGRRIVVGHGAVDILRPDSTEPALIRVAELESLLDSGRIHYVALGDRHSVTQVGGSGRIWYSGTQEVTDFDEVDPGQVLVVDLDRDTVVPHRVGTWTFVRHDAVVNGDDDVSALADWLEARTDKDRTVVKLSLTGTVSVRERARVDDLILRAEEVFAAIQLWERSSDLAVLPAEGDFGDLGLVGFADDTLTELTSVAATTGPDASTAQDALGLLFRLAGGCR
jgi:DNA repair exonuclease SbcCD nuclease subunit